MHSRARRRGRRRPVPTPRRLRARRARAAVKVWVGPSASRRSRRLVRAPAAAEHAHQSASVSCRLWEPIDAEWSCASRNDEAEGSVAPGLTSSSSFSRSSRRTSSLYERIERAVVSSLSLRRSICARAESRSSVRNTSALEADQSSCSRDLSFCAMSSLRAASVAPPFFDLLDCRSEFDSTELSREDTESEELLPLLLPLRSSPPRDAFFLGGTLRCLGFPASSLESPVIVRSRWVPSKSSFVRKRTR